MEYTYRQSRRDLRRRGYWRGFRTASVLFAMLGTVAYFAVFRPFAPDYTMSAEQYDEVKNVMMVQAYQAGVRECIMHD